MNNQEFYVYAYLDPRKPGDYFYKGYYFNFEPFYIGKGKKDRCFSHLKDSDITNRFKKRVINKILKANLYPDIRILYDNLLEESAYELEYILVESIGRKNIQTGPLTNLISGGIGKARCMVYTDSIRYNISEAQKRRFEDPFELHKHTKKMKECHSSEEYRSKLSKTLKEAYSSEEYKKRRSRISKKYMETEAYKINASAAQKKRFSEPDEKEKYKVICKEIANRSDVKEKNITSHSKNYIVTTPLGEEIFVNNLKKWCAENNPDIKSFYSSMLHVANGLRDDLRGWKCQKAGE